MIGRMTLASAEMMSRVTAHGRVEDERSLSRTPYSLRSESDEPPPETIHLFGLAITEIPEARL